MRIAALVIAAFASSVINAAAQQGPPVATPPATSPPATAPPATAVPTIKPGAVATPTSKPPAVRPPRTSAPSVPAPTASPQAVTAPQGTPPPRTTTPEVPRPGQKAPAAPGWTPGAPGASWQNVRLDVKIFDTVNPDGGKVVTIVCMDGQGGQVRSQAGDGLINIDAKPTVRADGRIWVQLTIEYFPEPATPQPQSGSNRMSLGQSLSLVVVDGKPMVASQSADPKSDRKVMIELTATIQPIK